jgi:hypothetical protein
MYLFVHTVINYYVCVYIYVHTVYTNTHTHEIAVDMHLYSYFVDSPEGHINHQPDVLN